MADSMSTKKPKLATTGATAEQGLIPNVAEGDEANPKRGEWRTHIHIPIEKLVRHLPEDAKQLDKVHISLSKPCSLSRHEIDRVRDRITRNIAHIKPFNVTLTGESLVKLRSDNDETFGAMRVTGGQMQIQMLIDAVDEALQAFGKEPYYDERILHASLASWATAVDTGSSAEDSKVDGVTEIVGEPSVYCVFRVKYIVMRSGHLYHQINLTSN